MGLYDLPSCSSATFSLIDKLSSQFIKAPTMGTPYRLRAPQFPTTLPGPPQLESSWQTYSTELFS